MRSTMKSDDLVYSAIADPTRRAILDRLKQSESSVKDIAAAFRISQPAISQHLRELRVAKLVDYRKIRRENRYRLTPAPLRSVASWLDGYRILTDPAGHAWAIGTPARSRQNHRESTGKID